jgi:peptide/nickel transport system substrate-binding protein
MDRETRRSVEEYRRSAAGPIENNLIDELVNGEFDRQEFLRRGAMFGLSASVLGSLLSYVGEAAAAPAATSSVVAVTRGGTLRVGMNHYVGSNEPYKLGAGGSLAFVAIPGEYLTFSNNQLRVRPWLAAGWKPNADATVWTFDLRRGVKFHDGKTMTADDVVASFKQYTGNKQSQALSVFQGILGPEGVVKRGRYTVEFRLKQPTGSFPYLVSQTTYQAIIQPKRFANRPDSWVPGKMIGTGPFRLVKFTDQKSADLVRFDAYWGGSPPLDAVRLTFYESPAAQVLGLRGGQVDLVQQLSPQAAAPFRTNSRYSIFTAPTASHRQFCLRVDRDPFRDARTRRAIALVLNRPDLIQRLLVGAGTLGNDSPFWSRFPSTDPSIKQRRQDIALARKLLAATGQEDLKFTITTHRTLELPEYAEAIQAAGRPVGLDISLEVQSDAEYFGGGADYYATTPWLNKPATITEWGARGVPNVYLVAAYLSDGIWNAAHYKNAQLDSAAKSFLGAVDVQTQRRYTKKMAGILLRDTPVVTTFHANYVTAGLANVKGYQAEGLTHVRLAKTYLA